VLAAKRRERREEIRKMSRKSLSREEKCAKLLKIFHDTNEFYSLKELEKLAKETGMVIKDVKEILQSLVDDGRVESDKISQSLYFWSFANRIHQTKQKQLDELRKTEAALRDKLVTLQALKSEQEQQQEQVRPDNESLFSSISSRP